jgi:hypothetical protein
LESEVWNLEFPDSGLGHGVWFAVWDLGVWGRGLGVGGFRYLVSGVGFEVWVLCLGVRGSMC